MKTVDGKWFASGFLDINNRHPELFGECILLRDDDGMGFALNLDEYTGKEVRITIELEPEQRERTWKTDTEKRRPR